MSRKEYITPCKTFRLFPARRKTAGFVVSIRRSEGDFYSPVRFMYIFPGILICFVILPNEVSARLTKRSGKKTKYLQVKKFADELLTVSTLKIVSPNSDCHSFIPFGN